MNNTRCLSGSPLRRAPLFALVILALPTLSACGGGGQDNKAAPPQASQQAQPAPAATPATAAPAMQPGTGQAVLAGVSYAPPAAWQDLGPSNMRVAQYRLPPVEGDSAPAEVNVFYFGPASGGGVDANLQRWIGQMVLPSGGDPASAAQRSTFAADGMPGHIVTLDGTYKSGGGPMMGGETKMLEGYRLVGVVLEGPEGSLFFKLTGPVATAKAMEAQLVPMMQGAKKAG
ncbi:MAG: hypothetical protein IPK64_14770 [bacterium]|nr:hypothetical protein [bacterium]